MGGREISRTGRQRQLAGSRRGSAVVREAFGAAITRRRYCQLVGIHSTTLSKWEKRGILRPEMALIMNSPTRVFAPEDVELGRRIIGLLRENPGRYAVDDAARIARAGDAGMGRDG
jgi:hypothetical protein